MFKSLKNGGIITNKELKYFSFAHKIACNLEKLYFLSKIDLRFYIPMYTLGLGLYGWHRDWILKNARNDTSRWYHLWWYLFHLAPWKKHLQTFLQEFNDFDPDLRFTFELNKKEIQFSDL